MLPKTYHTLSPFSELDVTAKGPFPNGKPLGVTVHYTANRSVSRTVAELVANGLGYHLTIDRSGSATQMISFDKTCYHAGRAVWRGLSPNHNHLAVSLVSWGYLSVSKRGVFTSYSGAVLPQNEVAHRPDNIGGLKLMWDAATPAQVSTLINVLRFCMTSFSIGPENICGHDECAMPVGRKMDPGGVLPFTMKELREILASGIKNV